MERTLEEIAAIDKRAIENRQRRQSLPVIGNCKCCISGQVREWPTSALECDNPYCSIMRMSLEEFNPSRKSNMRTDILQLTQREIDDLY